jgi:flavin-dependent dehydrogenase
MEEVDIAIVGAGPAGCMAACLLAPRYKVLLLERYLLPRDKSCSGVLVRKSVDLLEKHLGAVPEKVLCTPHRTSGLSVITALRHYDFPDGGLNVTRSAFDCWLAREAERRGAILAEGSLVTGIGASGTEVHFLRDGERTLCRARLVVACDGGNGICARLAGLPLRKKVVTFQKFYKARIEMDPGRFYAFTSPEFSRYDAWLNCKDGAIVAGSIAATRAEAAAYQQVFEAHLAATMNLRIDREIKTEIWTLPLISARRAPVLCHGGVFFCGEAAGLLNPFGEGMSVGMASAEALALACLEGDLADRERLLAAYSARMAGELAYMGRQWDYVRQLSPEFARNLELLDAAEEP